MVRVLAVADETVDWLDAAALHVDVVLAAGDLPFDYLARLADAVDRPCVLVPGNHDADLSGYARRGIWLRAGFPQPEPGPPGWRNADGRIITAGGLVIAGLGGSIRYTDGPNQWTERQQSRRARRLIRAARNTTVDILLTHAPPRGVGDREDPAHRGFTCLHDTVRRIKPAELLHGHIHPHGQRSPDRELHGTRVRNVVGHRIIELTPRAEQETAHAP